MTCNGRSSVSVNLCIRKMCSSHSGLGTHPLDRHLHKLLHDLLNGDLFVWEEASLHTTALMPLKQRIRTNTHLDVLSDDLLDFDANFLVDHAVYRDFLDNLPRDHTVNRHLSHNGSVRSEEICDRDGEAVRV